MYPDLERLMRAQHRAARAARRREARKTTDVGGELRLVTTLKCE